MAYKIIKGSNKITGNQTFTNNISASVVSASFFVGDGSLLTNVSASNAGSGAATGQGPENSVQFKSGSFGAISGSNNLLFDYTIPKFTANSGFVVNRVSSSTNITLTPAQHIVGINTSIATASIIVTLPNASTLSNGQMYVVKDEGGLANTYTILVSCSVTGQTIDGESSVLIESPYSAINIYCNGVDKYYIY